MDRKTYALISGLIFTIVAIVHLCRFIYGWEIVIAGWAVPVWGSVVGFIISAALAGFGLRFANRD